MIDHAQYMKLLYDDKRPFKEVSKIMGVAVSTLTSYRHRKGLPPRGLTKPPWLGKKRSEETKRKISVSREGLPAWNKKYPDLWNCTQCGKQFPHHGHKRQFCSFECYWETLRNKKLPDISGPKHWHYNPNREEVTKRAKFRLYFNYADKTLISKRQKYRCNVCRIDFKPQPIYKLRHHVFFDHIVPIKLNGPHSLDNGQMLCRPCGNIKNSKDLKIIMRIRGR